MKSYFKPTLVFAAASTGSTSTCSVKLEQSDLDLIADIIGEGFDANQIFGMQEACSQKVPVDLYCKFTSAESGSAQAFIS